MQKEDLGKERIELNSYLLDMIGKNAEILMNTSMRAEPKLEQMLDYEFGKINPEVPLLINGQHLYAAINIYFERFIKGLGGKYAYKDLENTSQGVMTKGEHILQRLVLFHLLQITFLGHNNTRNENGEEQTEFVNLASEIERLRHDNDKLVLCINEIYEKLENLKLENTELRRYIDIALLDFGSDEDRKKAKELEELKNKEEIGKLNLYPITFIEPNNCLYENLNVESLKSNEGLVIKRKYGFNVYKGKVTLKEISPFSGKVFKGEIMSFECFLKKGIKMFKMVDTSNPEKDQNDILEVRRKLNELKNNGQKISRTKLDTLNGKFYLLHVVKNQIILEEKEKKELKEYYLIETVGNCYSYVIIEDAIQNVNEEIKIERTYVNPKAFRTNKYAKSYRRENSLNYSKHSRANEYSRGKSYYNKKKYYNNKFQEYYNYYNKKKINGNRCLLWNKANDNKNTKYKKGYNDRDNREYGKNEYGEEKGEKYELGNRNKKKKNDKNGRNRM